MTTPRPEIPIELARWAAASLVEGESLAVVVAALMAERIEEIDAVQLCASFYADDPGFEAARWVSQRLKKLQSLLTIRQELATRSGRRPEVLRCSGVDAETFRDSFYASSAPVLLTDAAFEGLGPLSLESVVDTVGKSDVEVLSVRPPDATPPGDPGGGPYRWRVALASFLDDCQRAPLEERAGMVCDPQVLATPAAGPLTEGLRTDERYLTPEPAPGEAALWIGVIGSSTPLHHHDRNQLVAVRAGRLAVTLISPLESHCLYNTLGAFSPIDTRAPDERRYPLWVQVSPMEIIVYPGETLFVPVGWWYQLEALETTIAVSFTNLALPNHFEIFEPDIDA